MSALPVCFLTLSAGLQLISCPICWNIPLIPWRKKLSAKLIKKGAKAKSDEIIEAIRGYNIETDQAKKLELARGHLEYLDDMITQTEVNSMSRIKPYYEFVEFVSTMPE